MNKVAGLKLAQVLLVFEFSKDLQFSEQPSCRKPLGDYCRKFFESFREDYELLQSPKGLEKLFCIFSSFI